MTPTTVEESTVEQTTVTVHGVETTVRRAGAGRPVLFLHGAFLPTAWLPFHDHLATRCDLIAPVHPGYMEGVPPPWLRGFDDLVLHYRALLDVLGVATVDVVGFDLGGWLAGTFAAFHPERVRSLTVIAPTGLRIPDAPPMEWLAAAPARVLDALFNGTPGDHAGLFPGPDDIDGFIEVYGHNGVTARLIWEQRYDTRLERRLSHLDLPVHVITPQDDRMVPPRHAERWAELVAGATLTRLPDVGHAALVQDPATVAEHVLAHLEEVPL